MREGTTMRRLSGGRFAVTVVWRLIAFVALSVAGPWIATTIQQATDCTGTDGACAAISVGTGTLLRPLILFLLALALLRPCWRRMRAVGMWGIAGLAVPVLLLLDWRTLTAFGLNFIPVNPAAGLLRSGFPFFTALALLIVLLLVVARTSLGRGDSLWRRGGIVGGLGWLATLVAIVAGAVSTTLYLLYIRDMATAGFGSPLFGQAIQAGHVGVIAALVAMLGMLWMIVAELVWRRPPAGLATPAAAA
jgi:hypothetical protein